MLSRYLKPALAKDLGKKIAPTDPALSPPLHFAMNANRALIKQIMEGL